MKKTTIKSIVMAIIIMLFAIGIPNHSKAAFSNYNIRSIEDIYIAMRQNGDSWLNSSVFGIGQIWRYNPSNRVGNGFARNLIYSTGAGCIGHGKQGSGSHEYDMGKGDRKSKNSCI